MNNSTSNGTTGHWGATSTIGIFNSYAYLIALPIIIVFGLFGNSATAICLVRRWQHLTPNQIPFVFLCIADCGTLLIAVNNFISQGLTKFRPEVIALWRLSNSACKGTYYFYLLFNTLSSAYICLAAVDRFLALTFPFKHKMVGKTFMTRCCVVVFLVFASFSTIAPIFWRITKKLGGSCFQDSQLPTIDQVAIQMYMSLIVNGTFFTVLVLLLNMLIIIQLRRRSQSGLQANTSVQDNRATTVLLLMTGTYTVLVLPKSVLFTISTFCFYFLKKPWNYVNAFYYLDIGHTLNLFYYLNCAVNWIILVVRLRRVNRDNKKKKTRTSSNATRSTRLSSNSTFRSHRVEQTRM